MTGPLVLAPSLDIQERANATLQSMGWTIMSVEVDLTAETARIEVKGHDGRLLTLDARNGKATLIREQTEIATVVFGRRGDRCPVERLRVRFLGRHIVGAGVRSGLRGLAVYLDDNSTGPRLARDAMRLLLR